MRIEFVQTSEKAVYSVCHLLRQIQLDGVACGHQTNIYFQGLRELYRTRFTSSKAQGTLCTLEHNDPG